MANHKSAEKRARQTKKRTERNTGSLSKMKTGIKKFKAAVAENDKEKVALLFNANVSYIMQLAAKKIIHKNNASRKVSALAKLKNTIKL
ncbi:MAG: 30S ribosomal protein S20 [Deltaproteobacteria bacterium]|jgi:small subunit ribosomal protein S20|uniref:Small ribosomal subunit protein bS20 n=1 Tax=Candidatus Acidulodesulfobacterium acidiphilum TaxID=2597224 RepID=A0A520X9G5_9DELT|nr:30S ribosomal protein S20 [Deltaproteobacteria bacterium]MDA8299695.1 30S ribosomal protein S20 [Deltaproteobacteria bacterium]RZV37850.1 MAG: 30S ribosomal protein S20 [Candidatus Acidulodesulfobacterium acidiphilum]